MRNRKKLLAFSLGFTLVFGNTAYAEIVIPPLFVGDSAAVQETTSAEPASAAESAAAAEPAVGVSEQSVAAAPEVSAEGAVVIDANTGKILYGKNQDQQFYPASITKVMTALLVLEHCKLDETVTFSASATTNLESGAVSLGICEGDQLTVEQSLYGLLLKSANEIGNGLAEHVAGSVSAFADMMNAKAKALGCRNTHFANPHGLNDSTHKTTAYDMALIMSAALQNAAFRKIDTTTSYQFPATKKCAARTITMGHKMMYPTDSRDYEGVIGGKTGYTSVAGNTLVTGAEKDGIRLVAVVLKSKGTHYADTKAMLDYGFKNHKVLMGAAETAETAEAAGTAGGWKQDTQGSYYVKNDGNRASGEWLTLGGLDYWFDSSAYVAVGWRNFIDGSWYYFSEDDGHMVSKTWVNDSGYWYYLGDDGALLTNTTTPDGYKVDENGIWIH